VILLFFVVLDSGYSFYQHYHMPLYGDMAGIIIPTPSEGYYQVLHDPFGLQVLLKDKIYQNPNRFFAHWPASLYFLNMPLFLQKFVSPIDSVYLSCAIVKILIQLFILYLLAVFISGTSNVLKLDFMLAAALIAPLFQTSGYGRYMGIIDPSVIYTFFYALPLGLLLLFYLPFYDSFYQKKNTRFSILLKIVLGIFILILSLNGPLVPGVVIIVCPLVLLNSALKNYKSMGTLPFYNRVLLSGKKIPRNILFYFPAIIILCVYSLYIGRNNTLNFGDSIPLLERYSRIPTGIYNLLTQKLGYPLLLLMIITNVIIIRKNYNTIQGNRIMVFIKWIGIFAIIYLLLLPVGGFRIYRPNIIRYDTIMPITIGAIFVFGFTAFYLIRNMSGKNKKIYITVIIIFLGIFTNTDTLDTKDYACERKAIETIAQSPEKIVILHCDCPVMDWRKISDIKRSEMNAVLFYYWNITKTIKLYNQQGQ
jgi:hypothetical protein